MGIHDRGQNGWPKIHLLQGDRHHLEDYIHTAPGQTFRDLMGAMDLTSDPLRWQLDILLAQRDIIEVQAGQRLLYFPNDDHREIAHAVGLLVGNRAARSIMQLAIQEPGISR